LLLQRDDPTAKFRPSYIGHTGRLLPPDASGVSPPQAHDSDDAARRIVMKVAPFANPGKIDEHPRLLVANGTHGLYFNPGSVNVIYPSDLAPSECGKFDSPQPPAPKEDSPWYEGPAGFYLKMLVGGPILGLIWVLAEGSTPILGFPDVTFSDPVPDIDVIAPAGAGRTVKPAGLDVPDAGPDVNDWLSRQGEESDGRRFDFIVDRDRQVWWPKDFGAGGFQGRWGPRVENDPLGRRAGMRFPAFWRMFFLALENGKTAGTL
jgi:hypothetical protein